MGVPAFFRWLSRKYPSVIIDCVEKDGQVVNNEILHPDTTEPNPNGIEFDNLYLDMNGIIHPCTHPEDKPAPKNEDEMMVAIFECIDRLFSIVRPRKLVYMAIDGVAPRAKMNQQRSRRFKSSKEAAEKIFTMERIRQELTLKGMYLPTPRDKSSHFDSNCITPGTPFMDRLSKSLQYYIYDRLNTDAGWKNVKVILSDANVPGEGEHKIMDFIRRQRSQPDHDPNTQHVLCGADADLIMLGLATHEPNFTIIREEFKPNVPRPCELCHITGHDMIDCVGSTTPVQDNFVQAFSEKTKYIFVRLFVLREYLQRELEMPQISFEYDFERAVDDWVFMCFFVGNDFLPHIPSLEIREGAIDDLVRLYKEFVIKSGSFITKSGYVDPSKIAVLMQELGKKEDAFFIKRYEKDMYFKARDKANKNRDSRESQRGPAWLPKNKFAPLALGSGGDKVEPVENCKQVAIEMRKEGLEAAAASSSGRKRSSPIDIEEEEDDENLDEVRLHEHGFKNRYYESKFGVPAENVAFRNHVAAEYTLGLCWVLRYYYQGCASWEWYFPFHYAPFASDFVDVSSVDPSFKKHTEPFNPLEQLMSVFPAASRGHVPAPWAELMVDPECPIIDFYPEDFRIDLNGKKFAWQGVALLPFVDEVRLKEALKSVYPLLTDAEKKRNTKGDDRFYIRETHSGFDLLKMVYEDESQVNKDQEIMMDGQLFQGVRGAILYSEDNVPIGGTVKTPVASQRDSYDNRTICVRYRDPKYDMEFVFPTIRLDGAKDPPIILKPGDWEKSQKPKWQPRMSFRGGRDNQASLGRAGHRMINHHRGSWGGTRFPPPPNQEMMEQPTWRFNRDTPRYSNSNYERGFNNHRNNSYNQRGRFSNWRDNCQQDGGGRGGSYNYRGNNRQDNYHEGGFNNYRGGHNFRGGNNRGSRGGSSTGSYGYYTSNFKKS